MEFESKKPDAAEVMEVIPESEGASFETMRITNVNSMYSDCDCDCDSGDSDNY